MIRVIFACNAAYRNISSVFGRNISLVSATGNPRRIELPLIDIGDMGAIEYIGSPKYTVEVAK